MGLHLLVDYVDCLCIGKPMARHIGLQCLVQLYVVSLQRCLPDDANLYQLV